MSDRVFFCVIFLDIFIQHTTVCWVNLKRVKRFESYHSLSLYFKTLYLCVCVVSCVCVPISRLHISVSHKLWNVTPFFAAVVSDRKCVCAHSWWRTCSMHCRECSCTHVRNSERSGSGLCRGRINSCPDRRPGVRVSDPAAHSRRWTLLQSREDPNLRSQHQGTAPESSFNLNRSCSCMNANIHTSRCSVIRTWKVFQPVIRN